MDRLDLLAVQGTLKSLLQHHSSKAINFSALSFLHSPTLTSIHDHWKNFFLIISKSWTSGKIKILINFNISLIRNISFTLNNSCLSFLPPSVLSFLLSFISSFLFSLPPSLLWLLCWEILPSF